jgi:hypothetical protein
MYDKYPNRKNPTPEGQVFRPPAWLSVDELEDLLRAAIEATEDDQSGVLSIIDEYFARDETFEGLEYRRSLLRLLGSSGPTWRNFLADRRHSSKRAMDSIRARRPRKEKR